MCYVMYDGMNGCGTDHASGGDGCDATPEGVARVPPYAGVAVPPLWRSTTIKWMFF